MQFRVGIVCALVLTIILKPCTSVSGGQWLKESVASVNGGGGHCSGQITGLLGVLGGLLQAVLGLLTGNNCCHTCCGGVTTNAKCRDISDLDIQNLTRALAVGNLRANRGAIIGPGPTPVVVVVDLGLACDCGVCPSILLDISLAGLKIDCEKVRSGSTSCRRACTTGDAFQCKIKIPPIPLVVPHTTHLTLCVCCPLL